MDFIDICGASGAAYRFRPWPSSGVHPPIAGNFALVDPSDHRVVAVGTLEDLSHAASVRGRRAQPCELFTRLNIARRLREAEHADLAKRHPEAAAGAGLP
jgi:hypothetical protein